jgi:uncharacterized integral membrane protein
MKSLLKYLLLLPVAAVIIIFATSNRHSVKVVADPTGVLLPGMHVDAPLYLVVLVSIIAGVLIGGFASWLKQGKHRKAARVARSDTKKLQAEAERLRSQVSNLPAAEASVTAAYTSR